MQTRDIPSLCHMFQSQVERLRSQRALLFKKAGKWLPYTFDDWQKQVFQIAAGLQKLAIGPGDRVAILAENRAEWVIADMGTLHAGALDVPIYATNIASQAAFILQDSGAKVVFVSDEVQLRKILEIEGEVAELTAVVCMDRPKDPSRFAFQRVRLLTFAELLDLGEDYDESELARVWKALKPDDLATLIYTSGTTGNPKGVMLTHGNLVTNAMACYEHVEVERDALNFSFLPLSHAFERTVGYYYPLAAGMTIAFAESMEKIMDNLQEISPTRFCAVPRIFEKLHAKIFEKVEKSPTPRRLLFYWALSLGRKGSHARQDGTSLSLTDRAQHLLADRLVFTKIRALFGGRLSFIVSGGGPLIPEIGSFLDAIGVRVMQGYGLTEAAPVCCCNRPDHYRFDSVGVPLPGVEFKIVEDGEIWVRGGNVMKGYYKLPQETAEVLNAEGWLKTGDVGVIDGDGHIRITDRKKDIIVTAGGKNIAPQNLENKLKLDPFIEQVCVVGDNRKYISSLIVPNFLKIKAYAREAQIPFQSDEELLRRDEIRKLFQKSVDRVNRDLAPYESIRRFTLLPREFTGENGELTPTMKVRRRVVEKKYAELIERMY